MSYFCYLKYFCDFLLFDRSETKNVIVVDVEMSASMSMFCLIFLSREAYN